MGYEAVDWIHPDQDRDQWWALRNTVMNLGFLTSLTRPTRLVAPVKVKKNFFTSSLLKL
jgi:hypothetical protein